MADGRPNRCNEKTEITMTRKNAKIILLLLFGTIILKANSQNSNTMVELRDTVEINTTIAAVTDWFENLDTNFVRWNKRHTEFRYLSGGK